MNRAMEDQRNAVYNSGSLMPYIFNLSICRMLMYVPEIRQYRAMTGSITRADVSERGYAKVVLAADKFTVRGMDNV